MSTQSELESKTPNNADAVTKRDSIDTDKGVRILDTLTPVLNPFSFEGSDLRVANRGGNLWFVAADVCAALDIQNVSQAVENLDDDERSDISTAYTSSNGRPEIRV